MRERISYGCKTSKLPMIGDKLLFILSYLKNNPLQEYHGATFGMTQPQCNDWVHLLSNILVKTLKTLGELPDRNSLRMEHLLVCCKEVLLDGTEPSNTETDGRRKAKITHNVKNNLLCNAQKRILWLSGTFDGSVHDKKIVDEQPLRFPAGITLWQDTGFLGHNPKNVTVKMPTKKPKGKELKPEQKKKTGKYPLFELL